MSLHDSNEAPFKAIKSGQIPSFRPVKDGLGGRYKKAWKTTFDAVELLRKRFQPGQIRVTGSLLQRDRFHEDSDIDLVVPRFTLSDKMNAEKLMDRFFPIKVDIIPLKGMLTLKRAYFMERSVPVES